jgi:hypothetical protein
LNIFLRGVLPIEEFIFFWLTTLVVFGMVLVLACESWERVPNWLWRFLQQTKIDKGMSVC